MRQPLTGSFVLSVLTGCGLLVLAGCGAPVVPDGARDVGVAAGPQEERMHVSGGSMSLVMPPGWVQTDAELPGDVVFAAHEVGDETQQLIVSSFDSADTAAGLVDLAAVRTVDQGAVCVRLGDDTTFGDPRLVLDCAFAEQGVRKVLVPLVDGDRSAMVLAQLDVDSLEESADVLAPFLDGIVWE